jgi:Fe-S-cluster containining protein
MFIEEHWVTVGRKSDGWRFNCDQFDPKTRMCMAHDDRPPICQGYPWYGQRPTFEKADDLPRTCSFRADALTATLVSIGAPPS